MLYSKSTNGFYLKEVHGESTPIDAVEISDDLYQNLLNAQSVGKTITSDKNGFPILIETHQNHSFYISQCKKDAKKLLESTDYAMLSDNVSLISNINEFIDFRKVVRDLFLNPVKEPIFPKIPDPIWIVDIQEN